MKSMFSCTRPSAFYIIAMLFIATWMLSSQVRASTWPAKPIHMVVAYPSGSGTDTTARLLADHLSKKLNVAVIVENRPGASGRMGTVQVARAQPDGYTILFGTGAELTVAPSTVKAMAYDPLGDFEPVMLISKSLGMVVAAPDFPADNLAGLIAQAKAHPDSLNYGSGGTYSVPHLLGLQFALAAGIQTTHVPYKGGGPMLIDLTGSRLQYAFSSPGAALAYVQAGKLKTLAIAAPKRLTALPDIPTMEEQGYPGFDNGTWFGVLLPARTPAAIVKRLHTELASALASPEVQNVLKQLYITPVASSPEEFGQFLKMELDRYRKLAADLSIRPE